MSVKTKQKKSRATTLEGYRFIDEGGQHVHQRLINEEWVNLTGVSEVVKPITSFGAAAYYGSRRALMELGYDPKEDRGNVTNFRTKIELLTIMTDRDISDRLYEAYKAHAVYSKERAGLGTDKHEEIDDWVKRCIVENNGRPMPSKSEVIQNFVRMVEKHNPRFIASEKHGYNDELLIGGITDAIVETDQGVGIWDYKNRKQIFPKDLIQMGGYAWLHPDYDFTHVLGIPLEGKETVAHYDVKGLKETFLHQLEVYRFLKSQEYD